MADLRGANLSRADLRRTDLGEADLGGADLGGANLGGANLRETDFVGAIFHETILADLNLNDCKGLENSIHRGPSIIDIQTLRRSNPSQLPLAFLRGIGWPDELIDCLPSLFGQSIAHCSCFISYSSADEIFVRQLHADLQDKGIRCWFAPKNRKIGARTLDTLNEAIRLRGKVLLVLSRASITSEWVEDEVTRAFAEERRRGIVVLNPVYLDDMIFMTTAAWARKLRDDRHIGDFRLWTDIGTYQLTLNRLLRDLHAATA